MLKICGALCAPNLLPQRLSQPSYATDCTYINYMCHYYMYCSNDIAIYYSWRTYSQQQILKTATA